MEPQVGFWICGWYLSFLFLSLVRQTTSGDCKSQRIVLRSAPGYVSDGPGNYSVNGNCEWLIEAPNDNYRILLSFLFMETECAYDYLFVYDGDSYSDRLLASLSGSSLPSTLEATTGKMLLHLFSDANYNLLGFNATYIFSLCPQGCSGHGLCQENSQCLCDLGWSGEGCQISSCRSYAQHGFCNQENQRSVCSSGYIGERCDLSLTDNQGAGNWYNLSSLDPIFTPRAAAAGAFLPPTNSLYIFGGSDLNSPLGDLLIYNFTSNTWEKKVYPGRPAARHSHIVVEWNGTLILFGGELAGGNLTGDTWVFLPLEERWMELTPYSTLHPPPVANHAAATVDNWLYVFGGRTSQDVFSSQLFRLSLISWEWELVLPGGGKPPAAAGHSMVFHASSRTLLIFGGHRPSTARFSVRVNTTDLFHVDLNYWTTLRPRDGNRGPRERAFHSATVIGNYMVIYGGNLHIHHHEEKCYDEEIFFYHLGCHQWVPSKIMSQIVSHYQGKQAMGGGRYSHVAALMKGRVLLIAGGYSGFPRDDLLAFKVPVSVYQTAVQDYHLDYCHMYTDEVTCSKDPECTWCQTSCQTPQPNKNCSDKSCLGLARLLSDCQSCLAFSTNMTSSSHIKRTFGWCVQNETCMPISERSSCSVGQISGMHGWWGPATTFITTLDGCRTHNFLPGLHLITYHHPRNESQPDGVSLVRNTKISMTPSTEMDVSLVYKGFLYPMLSQGSSPERVSIWVRIQRFFVIARLGRAPGSLSSLEEVGRWSAHQEKDERRLQRNSGEQLFPNAERGSRYAVQIEGYLNNTGNGHASELSLMWDRTGVPGGSEISFLFLEPHQSDNCSGYPSCLACLADQGCGWCPQSFKCYQRLAGEGAETCKDNPLILSPSNCQLCEEYRECETCTKDPYCEWQTHSSKKGDSLCSRRGRVRNSIRTTEACPKACNQRQSCSECLSNSSHCAWCQSTGKCFYFAAYLAKYAYGECRDWYDSVHSAPQCTDCSGFTTCRECLKNFECGWCGNSDNPTVGRCYSGDFSGQRGYSNCSQALSLTGITAPAEPAQWSYSSCPDVDECRLEMAICHPHATCRNTPESYECHCNRGYSGDGITHCNQTCYNECSHGTCSGPPSYTCVCDLGWTSDYAAVNESGVECNVDCGCHFHSTCKHGRGICDSCQDWTQGEYCQECQAGSFGSAIQKPGCQECICNKHGTADLGYCNRETGLCYCSDNTQGDHCEKCAPGYYGDPRNGGTCYLECQGRQFIPSVSSSALGSPAGSYCLWVLSVSENAKPCHPDVNCSRLTLTLQPDIRVNCTHSYVYMFDGIPGFLDTGLLQSDRSLLGAFCGQGRGAAPITIEATTGVLVVYYEANNTEPGGFNATYKVHLCYPPCGPNQVCQGHRCVCRNPLSGPSCQRVVCPKNCSAEDGQGVCNQTLGFCLCYPGYAGEDCSLPLAGKIVWENLIDPQLTADTASRFLHRLGHTMVEGPDNTLWMFGGLSLRDGVLGSVYRYAISERRWTQMLAGTEGGGPGPSSRYFHAAAYNSLRNAMYVVGGLTARGASNDFWVLNLTTLQWRLESAPLVPPVAGHTLTSRRGTSLILIGGYSPENGFNNRVLEYSTELETWKVGHQTGTPPTGLYAHSSVYHEATDAFYVFGGQRFHVEAVTASAELYSLYYPNLTWSLLAPSQGRKPLSHFFHVAAILRDTMIVVGGRTEQQEYSNHILFYQIHCNSWIRPNRSDMVLGVPMNKSIGHTVAVVGSRLYISGGFNGVALGRMVTLTVPSDPCLLFSTNATCSQSLGSCVWCQHSCVSADTANRTGCPLPITSCFPLPRSADDCRRLKTCSECLAQHPRSMSAQLSMGSPRCKWCTNCPEGACIGNDGSCTSENDCRINQREIFLASNCSEISCEASDCHKCTASGKCMWTRQFKRTGETRRILSVQPTYDWTCFSHSLLNVSPMPVESSPPLPCPTPCHNHTKCHDCLSSKGADGGWQQCVWSVALSQCMSPTFLPMRCAAGACGRVLSGTESCSPSCSRHTHCAACIQHPRCGWCARREGNGEGECMEGGLSGHTQGEQCFSDDSDWAFMSCPPENECLNQHHDCNETQNCSDLPNGFQCTCKKGYTLHNVTGLCRPVCDHGCVNGTCVEPNRCRCDFGYVGENCSVACPCNKHSNCLGLGAEDKCEECRNNTMGTHCEKCKPLFVGSAINGGTCRSCFDFCRGNSEVCLKREEHEMAMREPEKYLLDPRSVSSWVSQGPTEDTAVCVNCQNNSCGEKCDQCLPGYFLLDKRCTKCQCNGHADTCSEIDGTNCPCSNNTETGNCQNSPQSEKKDCYKYQCAKCKDTFHGNPVNGRQCYRLMTVEQEYCFDPTSQSNCFHEPNIQNLPFGRTVFFGVQPKFTNVDIRVTVDVTFGCIDVFVSTSYETFSVDVDWLTGVHGVRVHHSQSDLDGHIGPEPLTASANGSLRRAVGKVNWLREERPHGLITYITVSNQQTVLVVRGVKDRVVITYPHELHTLKSSRFYLLLLGNSINGYGESQGLLFFRQDQAHIDLFVFFSVFFSCFFLFLSACVLLWKVKQWLDVRREQRRHLQEMSKMASRPFAKLAVYFQPDVEPFSGCHSGGPILPSLPHHHHHHHHHHHRSKPRVKSYDPSTPQPPSLRHSDPFLSQLLGYNYCNFRVGPITLEPTDDGMAGVVTLLLQLPGGPQAPNRACLGSALVTLRHNLQEYCGSSHVVSSSRKGLLSHENLTSMSL